MATKTPLAEYAGTFRVMASGDTIPAAIVPTLNQNTTGSAATLTTARTIALSGAATGTATSFNGSANISIPVTALNASNLTSGTVPDARLSTNVMLLSASQTSTGRKVFSVATSTAASTTSVTCFSTPKHTVSMFLGDGNNSVAAYTANESSGNIRFNGAAVGWGDFGYYPNGGSDPNGGNFRFSTAGSSIQTTPNASVGASRFISTVATGTAPLRVESTTVVTNLNADLLDGQHGSYYLDSANLTGTIPVARSWALTGDVTSPAGSGATTLANSGVTAGTYTKVTVDAKGRVTTGAALAAGDVPTLNQNTTGSAATLTTARTLTIGSTGKTFNGSANVSWSLAEIGAAAGAGYTANGSLDTLTDSGVYRFDVPSAGSPGFTYGNLLMMHGYADTAAQIAVDWSTGRMSVRGANGFPSAPNWRAWKATVQSDASVLNMVKMTQAAYDALGTKDATTIYVIVG